MLKINLKNKKIYYFNIFSNILTIKNIYFIKDVHSGKYMLADSHGQAAGTMMSDWRGSLDVTRIGFVKWRAVGCISTKEPID
jgi:hypothetical protein